MYLNIIEKFVEVNKVNISKVTIIKRSRLRRSTIYML